MHIGSTINNNAYRYPLYVLIAIRVRDVLGAEFREFNPTNTTYEHVI